MAFELLHVVYAPRYPSHRRTVRHLDASDAMIRADCSRIVLDVRRQVGVLANVERRILWDLGSAQ